MEPVKVEVTEEYRTAHMSRKEQAEFVYGLIMDGADIDWIDVSWDSVTVYRVKIGKGALNEYS